MPALDLALGLGMVGGATDVIHPLLLEPIGEIACDIGRAVIAEQPWLVDGLGPIAARCLEGQRESFRRKSRRPPGLHGTTESLRMNASSDVRWRFDNQSAVRQSLTVDKIRHLCEWVANQKRR